MIQAIVEAKISKPISLVFEYVSDLETMIEYNSSIKFSKWIEKDKSCQIKVGLSIITIDSTYDVTEKMDNQKLVAKCQHSALEFEDIYEFSALDSQTTFLRITDKMQLKGLLSLSEGILQNNLKREMQANMDRLVSLIEKK